MNFVPEFTSSNTRLYNVNTSKTPISWALHITARVKRETLTNLLRTVYSQISEYIVREALEIELYTLDRENNSNSWDCAGHRALLSVLFRALIAIQFAR